MPSTARAALCVLSAFTSAVWLAGCGTGGAGSGGPTPAAPCTLAARAGRATGVWYDEAKHVAVPINLPEVGCDTLATRDGLVVGMRLAFGSYDPTSDDPTTSDTLLVVEPIDYFGTLLTDEHAGIRLKLPGHAATEERGKVTFTDPFHGSFVVLPTFLEPVPKTHFEFSCDPTDRLTGARHTAAPATPPPGSATITRSRDGHVFVVDGVRCLSSDGLLHVIRADVGAACNFIQFNLSPTSSARVLGPATYPSYFSHASTLTTLFERRLSALDEELKRGRDDGQLELRGENPMRGFASFQVEQGFAPDRVEFTCP